jgi:hypothetical protein
VSSYVIKFDGNVPTSLNRVIRWNVHRKKREREMWEKAIAVLLGRRAISDLRLKSLKETRMRVAVTICNPRRYDDDNAHGACKVVFDAIRNLGLVRDDREEFMEQVVKQEHSTIRSRATVIEISEAA